MSDHRNVQIDMLDSIARKIAGLQMQKAVHDKTSIDPKVIMSVLCTAADLLRGVADDVSEPVQHTMMVRGHQAMIFYTTGDEPVIYRSLGRHHWATQGHKIVASFSEPDVWGPNE